MKYQYDESSGHGVLQQQHDHSCMTMTSASSCKGMAILAISLSWLEVVLVFA